MKATSSGAAIVRSATRARYAVSRRPPSSSAPSAVALRLSLPQLRLGEDQSRPLADRDRPGQRLLEVAQPLGDAKARSSGASRRTRRPCPLTAGRPRPVGRPLLLDLSRKVHHTGRRSRRVAARRVLTSVVSTRDTDLWLYWTAWSASTSPEPNQLLCAGPPVQACGAPLFCGNRS